MRSSNFQFFKPYLLLFLLLVVTWEMQGQRTEELYFQGSYFEALPLLENQNDRISQVRSAWIKGRVFQLDEADAEFREILRNDSINNVSDSITFLATLGLAIGRVLDQDSLLANNCLVKAEELLENGDFNIPLNQARLLETKAFVSGKYIQYNVAKSYYEQALAIYQNPVDRIRVFNHFSYALIELSDYSLAESALRSALNLLDELPSKYSWPHYRTYSSAIIFFSRAQRADEALEYAKKLVIVNDRLDQDHLKGQTYFRLSSAYGSARQIERSIEALERAIYFYEQESNVAAAVDARYNISLELRMSGRYQEALDYLMPALDWYKANIQNKVFIATVNLALIYAGTGDIEKELDAWNEAIRAMAGNDTEEHFGQLFMKTQKPERIELLAYVHLSRAFASEKLGNLPAALKNMEVVLSLFNKIRMLISDDSSRRSMNQDGRGNYDYAASLCYRLYQSTQNDEYLWKGFAISEASKAYTLMDQLGQDLSGRSEREKMLRRRIAILERSDLDVAENRTNLDAARVELSIELDNLVFNTEVEPYSSKETLLKQLSQIDGDLLEYHLVGDSAYVYHFEEKAGLSLHLIREMGKLNERVAQWTKSIMRSAYQDVSLKNPVDQATFDREYLKSGYELYRQLFPETIKLSSSVCLVPDGPLSLIPFAALPTVGEADIPLNYGELPYFNRQHRLYLVYSLTYLDRLGFAEDIDYDYDLLAYAPSFSGTHHPEEVVTLRSAVISDSTRGLRELNGLAPLAYNVDEVAAISKRFERSKIRTGKEATYQQFMGDLGNSRIIHLSTHGAVNPQNPNLSFLAFSQQGDRLSEEELLFFNDLPGLPLSADLVVLAACETNLGEVIPGENILSLGSAFAAAGARSTLTSLWKIDDEATKETMISFYEELASGISRDQALQNAQLSQLNSTVFAHPYYWSGFVLTGESGVLGPISGQGYSWWLIGGVTFFLSIILIFLFRSRA